MSASCCAPVMSPAQDSAYRRALWFALIVNGLMFLVEIVAGAGANSSAVQADALDFLSDTANYAISLFVLGSALRVRASASLVKAAAMGGFGLWVLGRASWHMYQGTVPAADVMGLVGVLALLANAAVAFVLYRYRNGDSNMQSVWLCTRNDMIGNAMLIVAASGVFATHRGWPDIVVAVAMAYLGISAAWRIGQRASAEIRAHDLSVAL
jgi:Co/Zn/Cd efflux system component